jgi:hypothetical protein
MVVTYNASGDNRKKLVAAISEFTGEKAEYMKMPTQAYKIDCFIVDKSGNLNFDDLADREEIQSLLEHLEEKGFIAEADEALISDTVDTCSQLEEQDEEKIGLTVSMPLTYFADDALENLQHIIKAKGNLIKKALGSDSLLIHKDDEKVSFPWFSFMPEDSDTVTAYTHFIYSICEMARNQKRISSREKEVDNEKYAFRCFLLRLGFIGEEYKKERKILLQNLSGSSAFKGGTKNEISK